MQLVNKTQGPQHTLGGETPKKKGSLSALELMPMNDKKIVQTDYKPISDNSVVLRNNIESQRLLPTNTARNGTETIHQGNKGVNTNIEIPKSPTIQNQNQTQKPVNNVYNKVDVKSLSNSTNVLINSHNSNSNNNKPKFAERKLTMNNPVKNKKKYNYVDNFLITSKYTLLTFLPKSLLFQFLRYANVYFLLMAILQAIGEISPLTPVTAVAPFCLVLIVSMVREGIEDYKRHVSDEKENSQKVKVWRKNQFVEDLSKNLEVGDIVLSEEYSFLPADIILLSCSNITKIAFIETANLDGEKNLKPKFCIPQLFNYFKNCNEKLRLRGKIKCEKPNADLAKFNGWITLSEKISLPLTIKQFLYKGK